MTERTNTEERERMKRVEDYLRDISLIGVYSGLIDTKGNFFIPMRGTLKHLVKLLSQGRECMRYVISLWGLKIAMKS